MEPFSQVIFDIGGATRKLDALKKSPITKTRHTSKVPKDPKTLICLLYYWVPWARHLPLAVNTTTSKNSSTSPWSSGSEVSCGGTTEEGRERANKERKTGGRSAV